MYDIIRHSCVDPALSALMMCRDFLSLVPTSLGNQTHINSHRTGDLEQIYANQKWRWVNVEIRRGKRNLPHPTLQTPSLLPWRCKWRGNERGWEGAGRCTAGLAPEGCVCVCVCSLSMCRHIGQLLSNRHEDHVVTNLKPLKSYGGLWRRIIYTSILYPCAFTHKRFLIKKTKTAVPLMCTRGWLQWWVCPSNFQIFPFITTI